MANIHNRFKEAQWFNPGLEVIIGGLGSIGSWTSLSLARQDFHLFLYDMDQFEIHNSGSQLSKTSEVGKKKTAIARQNAFDYTNNNRVEIFDKYDENSLVSNIMISCFDNMEARKIMFDKWSKAQLSKTKEYRIEHSDEINVFIDSRMLLESGQIYCVDSKKRVDLYKETLFEDSEVETQPCSARATSHTGMMIASIITATLLNKVANKKLGFDLREVPFKTVFNFINMEVCST